jgi:hypothetical protein
MVDGGMRTRAIVPSSDFTAKRPSIAKEASASSMT